MPANIASKRTPKVSSRNNTPLRIRPWFRPGVYSFFLFKLFNRVFGHVEQDAANPSRDRSNKGSGNSRQVDKRRDVKSVENQSVKQSEQRHNAAEEGETANIEQSPP